MRDRFACCKIAKTFAVSAVLIVFIAGLHPPARVWAADTSDSSVEEDFDDLDGLEDIEDDEYLREDIADDDAAWDPLVGWNRGVYTFNDKLYYWLVKPVAETYRKVLPRPARQGVRNFFHNLSVPIRFVNCLLQLKFQRANAELARFFFNSTRGVLGFGNPARHYPELNPPPEDTGQTLGYWGVGNGPYIVWPFLGPSTLRNSVGLVGDYLLNPISYSQSIFISVGVSAYVTVNQASLVIGEYEAIQEAAIDPYVAIREAYVDNREKMTAE